MLKKYSLPVTVLMLAVLYNQVRDIGGQRTEAITGDSVYDLISTSEQQGVWGDQFAWGSIFQSEGRVFGAGILGGSSSFSPQRANRDRGGERQRGDQQRRPYWSQVSTEDLLKFLEEHESALAENLKKMQEEQPQSFEEQIHAYKELFGPVMRQMERDPEAGKRSLEKIRLRLKIQNAVNVVKEATSRRDWYRARGTLSGHIANLFDVIIVQEDSEVKQLEALIKKFGESSKDQVQKVERGRGRGGERSGQRGLEQLCNRLEQRKKDIATWSRNKVEIVDKRVEERLQDHPNFPWWSY